MVKEMHRILKPGGAYVVISHGIPTTRLGYLSGTWLTWNVEYLQIRASSPRGRRLVSNRAPPLAAKPPLDGHSEEDKEQGPACHFLYAGRKS